MTLDSRIYVLDPVPPQAVFQFCRALIGAEDRHTFRETPGGLSNDPGQGLPAWLMLYHGDGAPLRTAEQAAAHDNDCNVPGAPYYEPTEALCDGTHAYRRAAWLTVSFDTAYGYSDARGYGCGDLHAEYIARLGKWLDSLGVRWEWMNEFTGEVHSGYDRLTDLGRGGADAADWFRTAVVPAIAADVAALNAEFPDEPQDPVGPTPDTTEADVRDAMAFNRAERSPALATVRDLILTLPGSTPATALASARVILAAHARELAATEHDEARQVGADMRSRGDRSRVAHCGGRHAVIADLRRHADRLDEQAAGGEQQ